MAKHYVSNEDVSVRMFKSDVLERFTQVHPAVPHVIFVPVILYMLYRGFQGPLDIAGNGGLFLAGLVTWTFTEYVMHRWVFHVKKEIEDQTREVLSKQSIDTPALPVMQGFTQTRYFVEHGVHHDFPNDSRRLVMPPGVSIPLAVLFFYLFAWALGPVSAPAVFAGFVTGYLFYDTTHYAVHHFRLKSKVGLYLKKHHFRHHYGDNGKDFGVSSPFWDIVFRTKGSKDARLEG
jgi:sterol desaturase/sphingolipid hydroxylase (fatty acid hydroxylase superfamily)